MDRSNYKTFFLSYSLLHSMYMPLILRAWIFLTCQPIRAWLQTRVPVVGELITLQHRQNIAGI